MKKMRDEPYDTIHNIPNDIKKQENKYNGKRDN